MNTIDTVAAQSPGPIRFVVVAAVLLGAVAAGVVFVGNPMNQRQPIVGPVGVATASPTTEPLSSASPSAQASTAPAVAPAPAPATPAPSLGAFVCASSTPITSMQGSPFIDGVRTGTHWGYDRLTIEFQGQAPSSIAIATQSGSTFTRSPRGDHVTLAGRNGIAVTLFSTDAHTAYSGPTDIKTGYPALVEVRQLQDFEGYVTFGLGISGPACYRTFMLTGPERLVIDIPTS